MDHDEFDFTAGLDGFEDFDEIYASIFGEQEARRKQAETGEEPPEEDALRRNEAREEVITFAAQEEEECTSKRYSECLIFWSQNTITKPVLQFSATLSLWTGLYLRCFHRTLTT